jgi:peptide deformylase
MPPAAVHAPVCIGQTEGIRDGTRPVASRHARGGQGTLRAMTDDDVLEIVQLGHPVLRRSAGVLDPRHIDTPGFRDLIAAMHATMDDAPGVGLAAPQVALPIRVAVMADGPERWTRLKPEELAARERTELPFTVLVNPVLVPAPEGEMVGFYEGCLSVPGLTGFVRRHRTVRVDALDHEGAPLSLALSGWPARIAQHEIDHLNGVLFIDHISKLKRDRVIKKFAKAAKLGKPIARGSEKAEKAE